jgi:hypothetical protein
MRKFFAFWWLCARTAFWGNAAFANDWQWIFGNPIASTFGGVIVAALGIVAPTIALRLGATEMTTGTPALDSFLGALFAFVITWLVAFIVRFFAAPVRLFHTQKDRADALEGTPVSRPGSLDKNISDLKERYLSNIPQIKRELLDFEVDGLRAINDVTLIFDSLAKWATKLTRIVNRHARKIASIRNSEKKRQAISKLASDLNHHSNEIIEYTAVFQALTPTLFECTSQFVERSPLVTPEAYVKLAASVGNNVQSSTGVINTLEESQQTVASSLQGISADLNVAAARLVSVNALLITEVINYREVCKKLQAVTMRKAAGNEELQN